MMRRVLIGIVLAAACVAANAPAEKYNLPVQRRTRDCTAMKGERIPLRFADGTPNGFFASANDPSKLGGGERTPCAVGCLEIDAHEIITTAGRMKLYFHPGGGPDHYEDHVENGQYGHVAVEDLKAPLPPVKPTGNGAPAPTKRGATYLITPTRIPRDMWYKPNVNAEGRSGSTYFTYGNPGYDKTKARGDFTYINWSWVQNGGDQYPENICRGGGMVRAIGKRGMTFTAADVEAIIGYSYGADNKINGRVTAFHGRTTAGPGEGGTEIFGWLPHSYQKNDDIIVPCVRRSVRARQMTGAPAAAPTDRMERMARNLLYETPTNAEARAKLVKEIAGEREAQMRIELLTELSSMDDAATVRALLDVIARDAEPRVREQAIVLIGYMAATPGELKPVCDGLLTNFRRSDDARERLRTIKIIGNIPSDESWQFLNLARGATSPPAAKSPEEFKAIEEALARVTQRP